MKYYASDLIGEMWDEVLVFEKEEERLMRNVVDINQPMQRLPWQPCDPLLVTNQGVSHLSPSGSIPHTHLQ